MVTAPNKSDLELSLFGPGYGECVLLHVGASDWLVVDSCLNSDSGRPAALEYLQKLGVDPATSVRLVVATHWHDDHIRGLSTIVEACTAATFVCSGAVQQKEFLTLIGAAGTLGSATGSGLREFKRILEVLRTRVGATTLTPAPKLAIADRCLWRRKGNAERGVAEVEVWSLSPSDASVKLALSEIRTMLPNSGDFVGRVPVTGPNHAAIVLLIRVGEVSLLLGSDLEELGQEDCGWSGILASSSRPATRCSVYKVAHHGSKTGDLAGVWGELLTESPEAVLTPFVRGNVSLPSTVDVARILGRTEKAYVTARREGGRAAKRAPIIEKAIGEMGGKLSRRNPPCGQVRLQRDATKVGEVSQWDVELINGAMPLKGYLGK